MPTPLPPLVVGPVFETSTQVYVENLLPRSTFTVYGDKAGTNQIGTGLAGAAPGNMWVPIKPTTPLKFPTGWITAIQKYAGSPSDLSNAVQVLPVPDPLPVPIFASGLCTCMDWVWIDGLIPGATLTINMQDPATGKVQTLVTAKVNQSPQWFQLPVVTILTNAVLQAQQTIGKSTSAEAKSYPIPYVSALFPPAVAAPVQACQTSLSISNACPGADLTVTNPKNGSEWFAASPSSSYNLGSIGPFHPGQLTAEQHFARCGGQVLPNTQSLTVVRASPGTPVLFYTPCTNVNMLSVSGLVAGEILTVTIKSTGTVKSPQTFVQGVSGETVTVMLPGDWYKNATPPVTLELEATLCNVKSGTLSVPVGQPPGSYNPPTLQTPLYACSTSVRVLGAHPGSVVQVFSIPSGMTVAIPRCDPIVATSNNFPVKLWTPLAAGERLYVQQSGCGANKSSPQQFLVDSFSEDALPVPQIVTPLLVDTTPVLVSNIVPGAQVTLFQGSNPQSLVDSIQAEAGPPTGKGLASRIEVNAPAVKLFYSLSELEKVSASQTLCGKVGGPGQGVVPVEPVPAPLQGLLGNHNYVMAASDCGNLLGVSVTIQINTSMIFESASGGSEKPPIHGFGFQLNCYSASPKPGATAWQQYCAVLEYNWVLGVMQNIFGAIINFYPTESGVLIGGNPISQFPLVPTPTSIALPSPYTITISLTYDHKDRVTGANFDVVDSYGRTYPTVPVNTATQVADITETDLTPIVAFEVNIVGAEGGENAVLSSGAGQITYGAATDLTVYSGVPCGCSSQVTAENSNVQYGPLAPNPGNPFSQSFTVVSS